MGPVKSFPQISSFPSSHSPVYARTDRGRIKLAQYVAIRRLIGVKYRLLFRSQRLLLQPPPTIQASLETESKGAQMPELSKEARLRSDATLVPQTVTQSLELHRLRPTPPSPTPAG